jgi:predicted PurR-regulated permease PerM
MRAGLQEMKESSITPGVLYRTILLAFGLVVLGLVFRQLITLVLAVLIVVIIATPLSAFATFLQRFRIPRGFGAPIGLLIGLAAIGGLVYSVVPVFTHEVNQFSKSLPHIVAALGHRLGRLTDTSQSHLGQQIQHFVNGYTQHPQKLLGPLESVGASVAGVVAAIIVVLLTALYTAIKPQPLLNGILRVVPPAKRSEANHILGRLRTAYIGWLRGLIIGMLMLGGLTYAGLRIIGIHFAEFFAVFTAIAMIVPYFGALVSMIPPVLYALTISPGKAIIVAALYIVTHQVESNMIQPLVVARVVELHPAVVAIGVVAVETLFGFVGLIVAVPILVTVKILIEELWIKRLEAGGLEVATDPIHGSGDDVSTVPARLLRLRRH